MQLVFLPSAAQDIAWFRHYYTAVFPAGQGAAAGQLRALQTLLVANPYIGQPVEDRPGVREFPVKRTPFVLIYRVTDVQIEVLRLWDTRRAGS